MHASPASLDLYPLSQDHFAYNSISPEHSPVLISVIFVANFESVYHPSNLLFARVNVGNSIISDSWLHESVRLPDNSADSAPPSILYLML